MWFSVSIAQFNLIIMFSSLPAALPVAIFEHVTYAEVGRMTCECLGWQAPTEGSMGRHRALVFLFQKTALSDLP